MKRTVATTITARQAGTGLLDLLERRFTYHTRTAWHALIEQDRLLVNGRPAAGNQVLHAGERLEFRVPEELKEPPVATDFRIVREDRDILVVDKPAGLPCHPAGRFFNHTLWALLRARPESPNPQFVNRLDRETSGLVLLAKTPTAARNCCRQFAENKVAKTYLAIVEGEFPDTLRAQGRLAPDQTSLIRKKQRFLPADDGTKGTGKWGATAFRRRRCQAGLSLIEARPETGRHHQIRATLAALGFPVVGDKVYGPDECIFLRFREGTLTDSDRALLRLPRQALHASELALRHPVSGLTVHCQAQLPRDMVDLIAAAARGNCGYPCTS